MDLKVTHFKDRILRLVEFQELVDFCAAFHSISSDDLIEAGQGILLENVVFERIINTLHPMYVPLYKRREANVELDLLLLYIKFYLIPDEHCREIMETAVSLVKEQKPSEQVSLTCDFLLCYRNREYLPTLYLICDFLRTSAEVEGLTRPLKAGEEYMEDHTRNKCVLCRTEYTPGETVRELLCMHIFHNLCILDRLRRTSQIRRCPRCRAVIA